MKYTVIIALVCAATAMFLPILLSPVNAPNAEIPAADEQISDEYSTDEVSSEKTAAGDNTEADETTDGDIGSNEASVSPYYTESGSDADTIITLKNGDESLEISLSDYLYGALAAEMPASFETEALKAQAVALRSYLLNKLKFSPSNNHEEDICSDSTCCAAWLDDDALKALWADSYDYYSERLRNAVLETDGVVILYDGEPISAVFHSSSAGYTENASEVWSGDAPYLVSVESIECADDIPGYVYSVTVSAEDFRETVLAAYPDAEFPESVEEYIGEIEYNGSGRIHSVEIGGVTISGVKLRSLFGLHSTAAEFSFDTQNSTITMTSTGYGHGVGMSQYGANAMACEGCGYEEILAHYYAGTELGTM